ncbi:envelope glycoprotein B [bovine alphaherpesvirus 1]|uniref:Glycoprotein B n=1 Tax=Bovine herpesvirus 1 TaxID=10320 RepID=A0A0U2M0R3_BHV1|nr:glycoprotein B [Bovine herpesvirus type 1.1]ALR87798.1 envelope glycoprotein B [Bovine alphaherpesvirus 1]AFV53391.1 glycoprotein B [Bovine herpesvirus type 1.1]AWK60641.1 envelope glycoprotein B [Bovine alphaherpesvirus 1]QBH74755.1 envelope glycoprotein B [Bovine alphaherpesvirus 1]QBH74829.1 envelope glycoprotein B [Bovine alphaherpesvirus 1]
MAARGGAERAAGAGDGRRGQRRHLRPGRVLAALRGPAAPGAGGARAALAAALLWATWALLLAAPAAGRPATTPPAPPPEEAASPAPPASPSPPGPDGDDAASPDNSTDVRAALRLAQAAGENSRFFVCPPPSGATVVRLAPARPCPEYGLGRNYTEGIGVIYKENIAPYTFKAYIYYKNVIVTTTWAGSTYAAITNQYTDRVPVGMGEITDLVDKKWRCLSKAEYLRSGRKVVAFDRDDDPWEAPLKPARLSAPGVRGWHTTDDVYTALGSAGLYRTGTSVNCIVEEVEARSVYPYDSFALSTGDIIYMSPFYGLREGAHREHTSYSPERFQQIEGYYKRDMATGRRLKEPVSRNFLRTQHVTVAWDWVPKRKNVCSLAKWREADEMLRDESRGNFRFTARSLSATFVSDSHTFALQNVPLSDCVIEEAEAAVERVYRERYNGTHVLSGSLETYLARGGFVVAFRPMLSNELAKLYLQELARSNGTLEGLFAAAAPKPGPRRARRAAPSAPGGPGAANGPAGDGDAGGRVTTVSSAEFAALQFTYDHIQDHVNTMFSRLATSWCLLQNKERALWAEAAKLNPSAAASAALDRRAAARMLGDAMAVTYCHELGEGRVFIENSMRAPGGVCYSRPPVSFAFGNESEPVEGQLGEDNELLPGRELVEPCTANHKRYFRFGADYVYYENYAYVRRVPLAELEVISTFVDLNLTVLEDREFLPLEVYTRAELADTGLLDYSEIQRRNQLHELRFYDIDRVVKTDGNMAIMRGLANFFQGLGAVGQAVGTVVLGAAGAALSTVSGIASFIANPFGALATGLLVLAGLVAAFLAYRYISRLRSNPMKALYPITTRALKDDARGATAPGEEEEEFDAAKLEQAREMIKYMSLVSAVERQEHKAKKSNKGGPLLATRLTQLALRRRAPPEYQQLPMADVGGA